MNCGCTDTVVKSISDVTAHHIQQISNRQGHQIAQLQIQNDEN